MENFTGNGSGFAGMEDGLIEGYEITESEIIISIISAVLIAILDVLTLLGNLLVITTFFICRELRTVPNYFLLSLSFADLLTGVLAMPVWLALKITYDQWIFGNTLLRVWTSLDIICGTSSIWNLCTISVDRCLAIATPLKHMVFLTATRAKIAILIVWIFSICVSLLLLVPWEYSPILIANISFFVPLVIIIVCYIQIYIVKTRVKSNLRVSGGTNLRRDMRAAKQMVIVTGVFVASWIGFFLIIILNTVLPYDFLDPVFFDFIKGLTYVNSCVNPFLYAYVSRKFRSAFIRVLRCKKNISIRKYSLHSFAMSTISSSYERSDDSRRTKSFRGISFRSGKFLMKDSSTSSRDESSTNSLTIVERLTTV